MAGKGGKVSPHPENSCAERCSVELAGWCEGGGWLGALVRAYSNDTNVQDLVSPPFTGAGTVTVLINT